MHLVMNAGPGGVGDRCLDRSFNNGNYFFPQVSGEGC